MESLNLSQSLPKELETNMDSISETSNKKSKTSDDEVQDKLSNLPDFIIGHILSYLPIKDAVRTSILSPKWKYMWTLITKLYFEDREPNRRNKILKILFSNFVYRVLVHLNTSKVQHFSLLLSGNYDPYHVNQWLSAVLLRGVNEVIIISKKKLDTLSSYSLLESQFLEKLVLHMYECAMKIPSSVRLSSLVILKLSGIVFTCVNSNDNQMLSLNFPVLRECELSNCTWSNMKFVTFDVPRLEVLAVNYSSCFPIPAQTHTIVKFCAPCLTKFSYVGRLLRENVTQLDLSITPITFAHVSLFYSGEGSEATTMFLACELLKQLSNNVECLVFEGTIDLTLLPNDVPIFGLLSRLQLQNITGEVLLTFLQKSPFLKTLILQDLHHFDEGLSNPENVPPCLKSNLEVVKFGKVSGAEHELRVAKFVMQHAQVLKGASFSPKWNLRQSIFERVKKKILALKRRDSSVTMEFPPFQHPIP